MSNSRFSAGSDWSQTQDTNSLSHYLLHHITFNIFMYSSFIYERLLNIQLSTSTVMFKQHTKLHSGKKTAHKSVYLNINHKIHTIYKIHAILSCDNCRRKKWLPMQASPTWTCYTGILYIIYTKAGTHLPTQIFTNCVPNTKHNKIQHSSNTLPVIW